MKKLLKIVFILMFTITSTLSAQKITGNFFWQEKTNKLLSSGYLGGYRFRGENHFQYTINEADGLNPIVELGGNFQLKDGKILFTVTYMMKRVNWKLNRDVVNPVNNRWSITPAATQKEYLQSAVKAEATIKIYKDSILIDNQTFYKTAEPE